jgi:hypothetical protein
MGLHWESDLNREDEPAQDGTASACQSDISMP